MNRKFIIIGGMLGVIAIAIGFGLLNTSRIDIQPRLLGREALVEGVGACGGRL